MKSKINSELFLFDYFQHTPQNFHLRKAIVIFAYNHVRHQHSFHGNHQPCLYIKSYIYIWACEKSTTTHTAALKKKLSTMKFIWYAAKWKTSELTIWYVVILLRCRYAMLKMWLMYTFGGRRNGTLF